MQNLAIGENANGWDQIGEAIETACQSIAPTWPLDRSIAVNPYWGFIEKDFNDVASSLLKLSGSSLWMPLTYYKEAWSNGSIRKDALEAALREAQVDVSIKSLFENSTLEQSVQQILVLTDAVDMKQDRYKQPAWNDTVIYQISQFCAAYFDETQSDWRMKRELNLFSSWRQAVLHDRGISLLMHTPGVVEKAKNLPERARDAIDFVLQQLLVPESQITSYLQALLFRINGWAAWGRYIQWQATLSGSADEKIVELLAIRLSWEYLLDDGDRSDESAWRLWQNSLNYDPSSSTKPSHAAILHRALELSYASTLAKSLSGLPSEESLNPSAQAVFCIDVRSEIFRRALEKSDPRFQTLGFAGFFGLPISYAPIGTSIQQPQLPGLLPAVLSATDTTSCLHKNKEILESRERLLCEKKNLRPFLRLPVSAFSLVEALGLTYLGKMAKAFARWRSSANSPEQYALSDDYKKALRPHIPKLDENLSEKSAIAERILRAMSLTEGFARLVFLLGHGSESANNPFAAGLNCGACCGQTGEINARLLASILNDRTVRAELLNKGINIPESTYFIPGLHNTTTDQVEFFDTVDLPNSHQEELLRMKLVFIEAGKLARLERAPKLQLEHLSDSPARLQRAYERRARDWAETRPEWGLANNAAFIVGRRGGTKNLNLDGRSFLHDYRWEDDTDNSVLELIMTAPMVVAHWINMQYYASTVDNERFGSGNKVLHNVVGGTIGVFEGNGGDLRIGLSKQSLHNGLKWMHTPLRLSVYIESPAEKIEAVLRKHQVVQNLVENRWINLFQIDPQTRKALYYTPFSVRTWNEVL